MSDNEPITLETELDAEVADRDIAKAVSARHSVAHKYVMRLRRRHPEATPAEIIQMLERHYGTSITTAGALITAGSIAASVGIGLIPVAGGVAAGAKTASAHGAKKAGQQVAKATAKQVAKNAAKNVALGSAKTGAQRVAGLLPAGDQQLQFEITAIFGLALAEIHGMNLDQDQAHALVYGLTNERVSQKQIATMAADVADVSSDGDSSLAPSTSTDVSARRVAPENWANTLADSLPAGAAQSLVRTIQTGHLETVNANLSGKQQAAVEYGVGALTGGVARFVFGRDVIQSSRTAFAHAPDEFPAHLAIPVKPETDDDDHDHESSKALTALEDAAKGAGSWIADTAGTVGGSVASSAVAVGSGVASAADSVARKFKSVDVDGDGIADEPQALTAVKGVGGAIAGVAGAAGGGVRGLLRSKKRD